jgi:hypothetical protein
MKLVVKLFAVGLTVDALASLYKVERGKIEAVIRDALRTQRRTI